MIILESTENVMMHGVGGDDDGDKICDDDGDDIDDDDDNESNDD